MEEDQMVQEWVHGLPSADDLTPLSQPLITPELAAAFGVSPEAQRSLLDVHSSSQETFEALRLKKALPLPSERKEDDKVTATTAEDDDEDDDEDERTEKEAEEGGTSGRAVKRPRLLWTPHLHRRFVEVVAHLGAKKAVPKAIMQLMNVDGLTRENVASHLQKYRLYLKRVSGEEDEEAAAEDNPPLTAPSSSYAAAGRPAVIPVPVLGGGAPFGMVPGPVAGGHYPLLAAAHRPYPVYWQPGGNKMGSNSTVHSIK